MLKDEWTSNEFNCLRDEIMDCLRAQRHLEIACIIAMGAVYSFLAIHTNKLHPLVWIIPAIFPMICIIRTTAYRMQVLLVAQYIMEMEKVI